MSKCENVACSRWFHTFAMFFSLSLRGGLFSIKSSISVCFCFFFSLLISILFWWKIKDNKNENVTKEKKRTQFVMEVLANRSLYKKGRMGAVGFEPTPPKRLVPKTSALDHSATLPCIPFFASKNKLISPFWHKNARPSNKNLIITGYRM